MGVDALLKRYFPAIVCALIALAAFFQSAGIGHLVASAVADVSLPPSRPQVSPAAHRPVANTDHSTSAEPILERNPFDSVTGPLNGSGEPDEPAQVAKAPPEDKDPYDDPPCDNAHVMLVTQADDPAWSFAAMAGPDGKPILRRQGDDVGGKTVHYVGWDRVWLMSGGSRCQAVIGKAGGATSHAPPVSAAPSMSSGSETSDRPSRTTATVPPEIASKIHKLSETEYNVERGAIDAILERQADLMRSARIAPEKDGVKLTRVRKGSLLEVLGLKTGDRLTSINGFDISDTQKALEAYARLRTADHISVSVNRDGKPMTIDFHIK